MWVPRGGEGTFWGWAGCCPDPVDCPGHVLHLGRVVDYSSRAVAFGQQFDFPISETAFSQRGLWPVVGECGLSPTLPLVTKRSLTSMGDFLKHSA